MLRNLEASHGLVFSHRLLLGARRVRPLAARRPTGSSSTRRCGPGTRSVTSGRSSRPTREITSHLDAAALDAIFDLAATVHHVDTVFDRLHELVPKEDPVHV